MKLMNNTQFREALLEYAELTERSLERLCVGMTDSRVVEAMRYSLLGGGKRVRAALVLACASLSENNENDALLAASAIEMIHAYSLIHDDLPAMDNDDMRRGKLSCHKQYGESTALLAGDGLLTLAFNLLSRISKPSVSAECTAILSEAAGVNGMIYGQELDLAAEEHEVSEEELILIHKNKTGALIRSAVSMGAALAKLNESERHALLIYAENLGLVFQIIDDILDCTSTTEELGKPVGSDGANNKTTYVTLYGIEKARVLAKEYNEKAITAVTEAFGDGADFLIALAQNLLVRSK